MSYEAYRALSRIRSLRMSDRGPKLLVRDGMDVIVARAGSSPLAWRRRDGQREEAQNRPWSPTRPAIDHLLRPPAGIAHMLRERVRLMKRAIIEADPSAYSSQYFNNFKLPHPARILRRLFRSRGLRDEMVSDLVGLGGGLEDETQEQEASQNPRHEALWESLQRAFAEPPEHVIQIAGAAARQHKSRELFQSWKNLNLLTAWLDAFPRDALDFLERNEFSARRWHLLNLWIRVPAMRHLMQDNPALAWIAASSWYFREKPVTRPLRSLRALAPQARKNLLAWLGIHGGEGTLRLLQRLPCHELDNRLMKPLSVILRDPHAIRWLQNLPPGKIDRKALVILGSGQPISFPILAAIHEGQRIDCGMKIATCYQDTLDLTEMLGDTHARNRLASIQSTRSLLDLHDRLSERATRRSTRADSARIWPNRIPSPLSPLPSWLIPLDTHQAVIAEGREMHHCVVTHIPSVVRRHCYLYRVTHPEGRATLSIQRSHSREVLWSIGQIAGVRNKQVKQEIHTAIREWLDEVQFPDPF